MLRRILPFSFALLLFALAFSLPIKRSNAPPQFASLILPNDILAQASRDTVDTLGGVTARPIVAPVRADSARPPSNHSRAILISTLVLIVVVCLAVWLLSRRDKGERYDSAGAYEADRSPHGRRDPRSP